MSSPATQYTLEFRPPDITPSLLFDRLGKYFYIPGEGLACFVHIHHSAPGRIGAVLIGHILVWKSPNGVFLHRDWMLHEDLGKAFRGAHSTTSINIPTRMGDPNSKGNL